MDRHTPLLIVVSEIEWIGAAPATADDSGHLDLEGCADEGFDLGTFLRHADCQNL